MLGACYCEPAGNRADDCRCGRAAIRHLGLRCDGDGRRGQAGRRLLRLCERRLGQAHRRSPPTAPSPASIPCSTTRSSIDVRDDRRGHGQGPRRQRPIGQQIGDFYASWMDEGRDRAARHRAAEALSRPDRRREDPRRPRRPVRRARLSPRRSASASSPTSRIRPATRLSPARAASACRTATITCSRARSTTPIRKAYRNYIIETERARRHRRCRRRGPTGSSRSKPASRKIHWTPERSRDVEKIYNPMTRAQLTRACAAVRMGPRRCAKLGLGNVDKVVVGETSAVQGEASCSRRCRFDTWKDWISPSTSSASTRTICPRRSTTRSFDFYSKTLRDVPEPARPLEARRRPGQRRARRGGRPDLRPAPLSGRKRRARCTS